MVKETPNVGYFLAEQAVRCYFDNEKHGGDMDLSSVTTSCCMEKFHIANAYMEIQREAINRAFVGMVLHSLPDEQQKFIRWRYRDSKSFISIGQQMDLPTNRLYKWNKRILSLIELFLFFSIPEDVIYHRMYLINLLHILDLRLVALDAHRDEIYAPLRSFLRLQRKRCRSLLDYMEDVAAKTSATVYEKLVSEKLKNPNESITDMASRVHYTQSCVNKHLGQYKEKAIGIVQSIKTAEEATA